MSAPTSSARTILPLRPRVPRSFSSSVIASRAVTGTGALRAVPVMAPTPGAGTANQTAFPRTPDPVDRDLDR